MGKELPKLWESAVSRIDQKPHASVYVLQHASSHWTLHPVYVRVVRSQIKEILMQRLYANYDPTLCKFAIHCLHKVLANYATGIVHV